MEAIDTAILWSLDFDAELPCESLHKRSTCSGPAEWLVTGCGPDGRDEVVVCDNAAKVNRDLMAQPGNLCKFCQQPCGYCWTITKL